jgi:hypothetical protein
MIAHEIGQKKSWAKKEWNAAGGESRRQNKNTKSYITFVTSFSDNHFFVILK